MHALPAVPTTILLLAASSSLGPIASLLLMPALPAIRIDFGSSANRIGHTVMTLPQLKIVQEVISLAVFVPFVLLYMRQPLKLNYLWASICMLGAVYFMFRK